MEQYIKLSTLNDFIFCPKSIYYHNLYDNYEKNLYQEEAQKEGTKIHETIDNRTYSTSKHILQWISVYNEYYKIAWKIDIFNVKTWELIERKTQIQTSSPAPLLKGEGSKKLVPKIYLGYRYQLWGQMFCLEEMWYEVKSLWIYSVKDNKKYRIYKPSTNQLLDFEKFLRKYREFRLDDKNFKQNTKKCIKCIYRELCDYYIWEVYPQLKLDM